MQSKSIYKALISLSLALFICAGALGQQKSLPTSPVKDPDRQELLRMDRNAPVRAPSGPGFYINSIAETPNQFSFVLQDEENRAVTGVIWINQVTIFEALLEEAKKFAESAEGVGVDKPIITRFKDKDEKSFVVDVEKLGDVSRFYVTISLMGQNLTVNAGAIKRGGKHPSKALFLDILARVKEAKASFHPVQQQQY